MKLKDIKNIVDRRQYLADALRIDLSAMKVYPKDLEEAQYKNCENMIGSISVPVGIAGPLKVNGRDFSKDYYLPLATTEGALVASVNRGAKAITLSGGANVSQMNIGMSRGAVFTVSGIRAGEELCKWLKNNFSNINKIACSFSSHLKLLSVDTKIIGTNVFVRFSFNTFDAMGMNMVTIAVDRIAKEIERKLKVQCLAVAGNFDLDKKPAWLNFISGRGHQVWAECRLPNKVIREVLKTDAQSIHKVVVNKCYLGSMISGSLGFNAHFANIVAAMFLATGQDIAHTVEGSLGITTTEFNNQGLYISIYLPDLPVGTVGGGTGLPSQLESLNILQVAGGKNGENAVRLAQIIGAGVLAGELSLLAALAQGSLAAAHQRLGRKNK